ncbi:MAG: ATP-binding cassette domain-containing protein [Candidatus Lokiarchaeota archaeon]|nr:ATP-binding cassette domain-containing protein [Candidatus Lokiarchaeota archaeon]
MEIAIETKDLKKNYGKINAVNGINLEIPQGSLFGFLGPNGAGKTTTISMLSTILPPSSGSAKILGYDIEKDDSKIKEHIGVCPQELVIYDRLTAKENIQLIAQMHKMNRSDYKERTDDLLGRMGLLERANDKIKKFSGGMKRRVNLLMAVIHEPEVLFLDEPTAGLDPQSRRTVYDFIKDFQKNNCTIILTTHNMEEADDLSDELVIIDNGNIIAQGTPAELKGRLGEGDIIEFKVEENVRSERDQIVSKIKKLDFVKWAKKVGKSRIILNGLDALRKISEIMEAVEVQMLDISIRKNTLEDVFIDLTGRRLRD